MIYLIYLTILFYFFIILPLYLYLIRENLIFSFDHSFLSLHIRSLPSNFCFFRILIKKPSGFSFCWLSYLVECGCCN
jgi:hypothetical protein